MEQEYWERFLGSGKVEDYLEYRGMEMCSKTISKYEGMGEGEYSTDHRTLAEKSTWKNEYSMK